MKHLRHLLTMGLVLAAPLVAEQSLEAWAEEEESSLATLEQELTLLNEEFEEFNQEIFSLEEAPSALPAPEVAEAEQVLPALTSPVDVVDMRTETPAAFVEVPWAPSPVVTEEFVLESIETPEIAPTIEVVFEKEPEIVLQEPSIPREEPVVVRAVETPSEEVLTVDLKQAFNGSPVIYSLLFLLSVAAVAVWLYAIVTLNRFAKAPNPFSQQLQNQLLSNQFDEALHLCQGSESLLSKMVASGIHSRKHGLSVMVDAMKAEGKRVSVRFWQKIGMLNDIAIIAPLFGLLGTVLGMFYAFYHVNRSTESVSTLFDGLGISVGTTVAGLVVAILALMLHSIAKYRLVKALAAVENEAHHLAHLIDDRTTLCNRG